MNDTRILPQKIDAFFRSYASAFEQLNAESIADHFTYPSHITSAAAEVGLLQLTSRDDCLGAVRLVVEAHRMLGTPSFTISCLQFVKLGEKVVQAHLRIDVELPGEPLYDFEAIYSLVETNDEWRIASIAHNQIPRLQACVTRAREVR